MKNCHILTDNKLVLNSTANFKRYTSIMIEYAQFGCVNPYTQMAGADETRCHISPAITRTNYLRRFVNLETSTTLQLFFFV